MLANESNFNNDFIGSCFRSTRKCQNATIILQLLLTPDNCLMTNPSIELESHKKTKYSLGDDKS